MDIATNSDMLIDRYGNVDHRRFRLQNIAHLHPGRGRKGEGGEKRDRGRKGWGGGGRERWQRQQKKVPPLSGRGPTCAGEMDTHVHQEDTHGGRHTYTKSTGARERETSRSLLLM